MTYSRKNALDQSLDISGSQNHVQDMILIDEKDGYGPIVSGQTGNNAIINSINGNVLTITNLSNMTNLSVGRYLSLTNSQHNNGIFLIVNYNSNTSVDIFNLSGIYPDSNSGSIIWAEREPYRLQDDLNYIRTDRKSIKGTTNWYDNVPTFTRPNDNVTYVPSNLSNLSGKTTDAISYNVNRALFGESVNIGDSYIIVSGSGFKHAGLNNDMTGIPCFDLNPFINDWNSCYVQLADGYTGNQLLVLSGIHVGERIFGITEHLLSTSPNSITIKFYSAPVSSDYTISATPYIWEIGQSTLLNLLYPYNERLDQLDKNDLRSIPALGILPNSSGGIDFSQHENLDTLVHNIAEDGYTSIIYNNNNIISYTIWTNTLMNTKIREYQISYTITPCSQFIDTVVTKQYNAGTLVNTLTETFIYSGNKIIGITSLKT